MNTVVLMGRLTKDPDIRYTQGSEPVAVARYVLAVDRRFRREGDQQADFIPCVVFGKGAEFAEKYLFKGTKIVAKGRIQTGSYNNKEGRKVYTTDIVVEEQEFAESKAASQRYAERDDQENDRSRIDGPGEITVDDDEFMDIPSDIDEELPFK